MSDAPNGTAAERFAIGISFGNSYSSIARINPEGKAEVIANEEGDRQIPSVLSYIGGEEYHGTQAKAQLIRNSKNTVAYFRDYLGKNFKSIDPTPCHNSAHPQQSDSTVAFSICDGESETPSTVTVSEIATRHMRRLRQSASDFLGKDVNAAVITVPTDFTDAQREALIAATKAAGMEVLQLIHEPVAAVLAYDARPEAVVADKLVVVADLGGTRSDAAVVACRGGMYTILATAHDYELGGATLDKIVIDHFAKEFIKKHKTDPREDARGLAKLKLEGEATKKTLSLGTNASLSIESLADGIDFQSNVNRTRYELLSGKVFAQFTGLIEQVVKKADLDLLDIDQVIFAGGASHTPKIAQLASNIFPETTQILAPSTLVSAINPSELAPRGAAIQASLIQEFDQEDIEQSIHPMVTATTHLKNAIGVEFSSGGATEFKPLMHAETALPARRVAQYNAPKEGGDVLIRVCEGVRDIKVTKPEPKAKEEKPKGDEDDSDFDSDEDDEEETREIVWKTEKPIAELAVKGTKAGSKVELMVHVNPDLGMQITAREVGGQSAVRGAVQSA
ncbi:actin-like ATPase domain-containing protein [Aspergillus campestris IBT 28561]|uniref:Actin-like ATPase domain-containing protein n=1 Tax=Aspergillus campestris (strain IBT 28561) TaxID=1392248 RepID=A0A2I1D9M3_ASPC2|nr:actin-like ATPase domain-containing protein [Aspergillus campestris IBT 28561]PKY06583.1 actin-like ATPase domain-containing protein [Aspergillus campestris IBT 28561]